MLRSSARRGRNRVKQGNPAVFGVCGNWITKNRRKKGGGVSQFLSRFRWLIQAGATLLSNIHLPNFFQGRNLSRQRKGCLCARTELLFLPGGIGSLPNRLVSGSGGFVKIQFFILYHRIPHIDRGSARAVYLRFFCVRSDGFRNCYIRCRQKSFPLKS